MYEELKNHNIYGRRYFYPLISQIPTYRSLRSAQTENLSVATGIAEKVLCLPIYPDLSLSKISQVCEILSNKL